MRSKWMSLYLPLILSQMNAIVPRKDGQSHTAEEGRVREFLRSDNRELRVDDGETLILARQLDFIQSEVFDVLFPPPQALLHIPLDNTVPPGADTFYYREMEATGVAEIITDYGQDLPRVDALMRETPQKVRDIGDAYGYSVRELQQAAYAQVQLDATKARVAREAIDRKMDALLALGDTTHGISGFLNHPNVPTLGVSNGNWLTTATPDEVLQDMGEAVTQVVTQSKGVHEPDTMLLPLAHYEHICNTPRSEHTDTTILEFFLRTNKHVKQVQPWFRLDEAGPSSAPRGLVYKKDPSVVRAVIPDLFLQQPPQMKVLEFIINCMGRIGGTVWYRPMAATFMDGI